MSQVLVSGLFDIRPAQYWAPSFITIDAAGEMAASIFRVPANGDITKVGIYVGFVSTSKPLRLSLQTVDATTGLPTGTAYKGSGIAVQASLTTNTFYILTLATQATSAVYGDLVAIVAEWDSVDYGNCRIMLSSASTYSAWCGNKLGGGAWAKTNYSPFGALEYSDGSYYHTPGVVGCIPDTVSFNVDTAGADEYGNVFNLPFDFTLRGFAFSAYFLAALTYELCYYTGSTLVEAVALLASATDGYASSYGWRYIPLSMDYLISKNTSFRLTVRPTNTQNFTIGRNPYLSAAMLTQEGLTSAQCQQTARLNQGAFTDTDTSRLTILPWISKVQDSGGGLLTHPGMTGGCRA